jgi:hypothetical protein
MTFIRPLTRALLEVLRADEPGESVDAGLSFGQITARRECAENAVDSASCITKIFMDILDRYGLARSVHEGEDVQSLQKDRNQVKAIQLRAHLLRAKSSAVAP